MNAPQCHREDELLEALGNGLVGPELSAHVDECPSCAELHLVAGNLLDERTDAITHSPIPSSGTMLFRMQMRQRHEAEVTARRSLLVGQALTLTVALGLIVAIFGAFLAVEVREVIAAVRLSTPVLIAVGTWLLLAPIGGYLAVRQK